MNTRFWIDITRYLESLPAKDRVEAQSWQHGPSTGPIKAGQMMVHMSETDPRRGFKDMSGPPIFVPVPELLDRFVVGITYREEFEGKALERGVYETPAIRAELERERGHYRLIIEVRPIMNWIGIDMLNALREFYLALKQGNLVPTKSYDKPAEPVARS